MQNNTGVLSKRVRVRTVLVTALFLTSLIALFYVWMYFRSTNPVDLNLMNFSRLPELQYRFSIYGPADSRLKKPRAVFVSERIYVLDSGNHQVQVFDKKGNFLFRFGRSGNGTPSLSYPSGLAEYRGELYVVSLGTHKIAVYSKDGRFLRNFADNAIWRPLDIVVNGDRFYVTDLHKHQVVILNPKGTVQKTIGKQGQGPGEFAYPNGMTVDKQDNLIVCDSNNNRLQFFSPAGSLVKMFPSGTDKLLIPRGVSRDNAGNLFLTSPLGGYVQVLGLNGESGRITTGENGTDGLLTPNATFWQDNRLYVADMGNNRILVYDVIY